MLPAIRCGPMRDLRRLRAASTVAGMSMLPFSRPGVLLAIFAASVPLPAHAASTGRLPPWVCGTGEPPLFSDGFETGGDARYSEPSGGSGGAYPGAQTRSVFVGGQWRDYYLHVPTGYPFDEPLPLLMALHGAGGAGTAPAAAQALRTAWATTAEAGGFIVVAPVASGVDYGSWVPVDDYPMFKAVIDDAAAHYDIDRSRIHGWGFSAGGHVMHDLALRQRSTAPDIRTFAAYGVSAGALSALTCSHGSGTPTCAGFLPQVLRKMPVSLSVGTADTTFLPHAQADRNAFLAAGWTSGATLDYATFAGGHVISPGQFPATWQFFCPFQRLPD